MSTESRSINDPFLGKDVQISDRLVDRLRGKYASGPNLPNGNPEFGWRQFEAPPIQHEAAKHIEKLEDEAARLTRQRDEAVEALTGSEAFALELAANKSRTIEEQHGALMVATYIKVRARALTKSSEGT